MTNQPPAITKSSQICSLIVRATYEVAFVLLPVIVWTVVLYSTGTTFEEVRKLAAWPFASLALYCTILRDGITTFHQDTPKDARERELIVLFSLIGTVLSAVLLTLAVLHGRNYLPNLWPIFYQVVWYLIGMGVLLLFVTKFVMLQRKSFGHYV